MYVTVKPPRQPLWPLRFRGLIHEIPASEGCEPIIFYERGVIRGAFSVFSWPLYRYFTSIHTVFSSSTQPLYENMGVTVKSFLKIFTVLRHNVSHRIAQLRLRCSETLQPCGFKGGQRVSEPQKSKKILDISQHIHRLSSPNSTTKTHFFPLITWETISEYILLYPIHYITIIFSTTLPTQ